MKTQYGDVPDNLVKNYTQVKTVLELINFLHWLPNDLPIGHHELISVTVVDAPSTPVLEFDRQDLTPGDNDEHF